MSRAFKLPDLGEGIHEGEVLSVLVTSGAAVSEGDPVLEVETDKAAVELPSPFSGTVEDVLVKVGDIVKVGDTLMTFSGVEAVPRPPEEKPGEALEPRPEPAPPGAQPPPVQPPHREGEGPVPASPATRRLARELGVDLHLVSPTGPAGLVTAQDVRTFASGAGERPQPAPAPAAEGAGMVSPVPAPPALPDFAKWGPVERLPVRSIRRATAKQMALSWSQIPHVTSHAEADMTRIEAFRKRHKDAVEAKGGKLTVTVFALKAAATALKALPNFNATLDTAAGELILKKYVNIGVAVNTEDGLIVPVIRNIDGKSITDLSVELNDLVQRTRGRKTTLEEMQGGTFTITNIGPMGGGHFTPIINYPEVAILGLGSASMKPVALQGEEGAYDIAVHAVMPISLTIDHRVLDGVDALRFLKIIISSLEDPDELLLTMT